MSRSWSEMRNMLKEKFDVCINKWKRIWDGDEKDLLRCRQDGTKEIETTVTQDSHVTEWKRGR